MIKQIGLPLRGRPILLITRMITDRIGLHSVLLPLLIFKQAAGLAPSMEQIEMLSEQLPDASLLKLYVSKPVNMHCR